MTLTEIEQEISGYLTIKDFDALRIVLATAASHELPGDPVWTIIVGPPSSAKTEFINLLRYADGVRHLSSLTPKTLASGFQNGRGETSYLAKLKDSVLAIKDLTTILEMDQRARREVISQLREVYDGRYGMAWGTGKEFQWEGRVTLIAGVTPIIHRYWSVMSTMGPRFLFVAPQGADREAITMRALENADEPELRIEAAKKVAIWLRGLPKENPEVPKEQYETLARTADLLTRGRTTVDRDGRTREVEWYGEPEVPARVAKQLHHLARGLARIEGRSETDMEDLRKVQRVARDTLPPIRRQILEQLAPGPRTIAEIVAAGTGLNEAAVGRALEELELVKLVRHEEPNYALLEDYNAVLGMNSAG